MSILSLAGLAGFDLNRIFGGKAEVESKTADKPFDKEAEMDFFIKMRAANPGLTVYERTADGGENVLIPGSTVA